MRAFRSNHASLEPTPVRLFLVALAVKLVAGLLLIGGTSGAWVERFQAGTYDDVGYYESACKLVEHHAFLKPYTKEVIRTVYRTPGYPFILAVLATVVGKSPLLLLLVQVVVLSAIPVVFLLILREMKLPAGWAWWFAVDPLTNLVALSFMTEDWLVLLLLLSLFCWLRSDRLGWRFASFLLYSLTLLIKPTAQFYGLVFLTLTLLHFRRRAWTIAFGLVSTLPLLLWMCRNYTVTGAFLLSTQTDAQIMAVETIRAKQHGVASGTELDWIRENWWREHGEDIFGPIMDNQIDFAGVMSAYAIAHPFEFARYHVGGMVRILFGTARIHCNVVFPGRNLFSPPVSRIYDAFIVLWYGLLYAVVVWRFRFSWLKQPLGQFSILFILYNLALIGVLAYTTGGGLKRIPFLPFLYLLPALSSTVTSGNQPWLPAWWKRPARGDSAIAKHRFNPGAAVED
jgi:hypothetical protein